MKEKITTGKTLEYFCQSADFAPVEKDIKSDSSIASFTTGRGALDAEILWALKCVKSHYSYKSCQGNGNLFSRMFPDSMIAKQFAQGESKCSYLISFGLAPYFKNILLKTLESSSHFILLFDETLNKSNQKKQLDILVRYWDPTQNEVLTKYFDSAFLGHSTAEDLLREFYDKVKYLTLSKLLQLSMDGPSVNWSFYKALQSDLEKEFNSKCACIGSCGLHVLNNAFRKGALSTDWGIDSVLVGLNWLFKDSPARRDDFMKISKMKKFPAKFCNYRWLENVPAAERAIMIWTDIELYVKTVEMGKLPKINNKSFSTVAEATKDKLFVVKLNFFCSVSKLLQPFLTKYQSDKPLLPFLAGNLFQLVKDCLQMYSILKDDELKSISCAEKLSKFDFDDRKMYAPISKVSVGSVGDKMINDYLKKKTNKYLMMHVYYD